MRRNVESFSGRINAVLEILDVWEVDSSVLFGNSVQFDNRLRQNSGMRTSEFRCKTRGHGIVCTSRFSVFSFI